MDVNNDSENEFDDGNSSHPEKQKSNGKLNHVLFVLFCLFSAFQIHFQCIRVVFASLLKQLLLI